MDRQFQCFTNIISSYVSPSLPKALSNVTHIHFVPIDPFRVTYIPESLLFTFAVEVSYKHLSKEIILENGRRKMAPQTFSDTRVQARYNMITLMFAALQIQ